MPRSRRQRHVNPEVTSLAPLPPAIENWERALIEPVLARLSHARVVKKELRRAGVRVLRGAGKKPRHKRAVEPREAEILRTMYQLYATDSGALKVVRGQHSIFTRGNALR